MGDETGIWRIEYLGAHGGGFALVILENGYIAGTDERSGIWNGEYCPRASGGISVQMEISYAPNVASSADGVESKGR